MPYKEQSIEKRYFTIKEVASEIGVTPSLIRFWETEFEIINPKRNRNGNRQFTKEDIDHVKLIYHLVKEQGFTLQGAKEVLKVGVSATKDKTELITSLKEIKSFLVSLREKIN